MATMAKLEGGEPAWEYRPIAFDDKKIRYVLDVEHGGGWSASAAFPGIVLGHDEYRLNPQRLGFDDVKALGIEVIPSEVRRREEEAKSSRAFQEARDAGIEILPQPKVDAPFIFTLTDSDGLAHRSATLKGKVVLIDCWADWRSPCMGKMNEIKDVYKRRRGDGFEVIGVNLNRDRGKVEPLVKKLALPWPQVYVPGDDRTRRLWADGPGIASPHLLLIDRDGVLRWYGGPEELEKRIGELLDAPRASK
jgi:thiol-disulfide isomerase/thioredoxin